ncbi:ABC transporter permease [Pseudooceanicola nanhaiensis]|jgi:putative spermidine/putrescine transport system permease protein|uniref:ABC transporter permease n=1 Tax=Pseudooceanicola nanhaiensis TaxID=375761 RepID=A0A917SQC3_9RHOB|nr:ABC transporter permease [Pseudooceanicola nanhaiensis]GGL92446.1 ABC transporter permease [Pseudooceanicola nanhaiensis]
MRQKTHPLLIAFAALTFAFLIGPLVIIIGTSLSETSYLTFPPEGLSLKWYENIFEISAFRRTMVTSFILAVGGTALSMAIGIPAAYAMARYRVQLPAFLGNIYVLPILIPEIVLGFSLMKSVAIGADFPIMAALFVGHALLVLPYCVRVVGASLNAFDFSIEEAAVSLGCPRWKAFFLVVLPNVRAGIIAGFILAFITSLNDVSISIFLTGPGVSTLPIQLLAHMEQFFDPTIAAVSVLLMFVTVGVMAIVERTLGLTFLTK